MVICTCRDAVVSNRSRRVKIGFRSIGGYDGALKTETDSKATTAARISVKLCSRRTCFCGMNLFIAKAAADVGEVWRDDDEMSGSSTDWLIETL